MIDELIAMRENDLSKDIIVPLLRKMYSCRVDFSGGTTEKGRDIIIYKQDEFGINDFIGIQVKRTKATANSTTNSIQQLMTQITQMKKEGVIDPNTSKRIHFSKFFFITPYIVNDAARDSHSGAMLDILREGVRIIDGLMLNSLIETHAPELIQKIKGERSFLIDKTLPKLTNESLMKALSFQDHRELCDIYCEAGFTSGNKNYSIFTKKYTPNEVKNNIQVDAKQVTKIIADSYSLNRLLGEHLISSDLLADFNEKLEKRASLLIDQTAHMLQERKLYAEMAKAIALSNFRDDFPDPFIGKDANDFFVSGFVKSQNVDFITDVVKIKGLHDKRLIEYNADKAVTSKLNDSNFYSFKFRSTEICNALNEKINTLREDASDAKSHLKPFLLAVSETQKILSVLHRYTTLLSIKTRPETRQKLVSDYTISDVFNTRLNAVLLGEAGSGKTTNLQIYAINLFKQHQDELIIYMTLDQLSELANSGNDKCILKGVVKYLIQNGIESYTTATLAQTFKFQKTTLILDSVDEAIVNNFWILKELNDFAKNYSKCQIITSSRYTVNDIESLDFINVSLLPFNTLQKVEFFNKWFVNQEDKAKELIEHLTKYPKLNSVVTNPLSATIMATLQDNKIQLPKTESSLYKKRFELLSGMFDKFKGVNRSIEQPDTLLTCAQFLAYGMHVKGDRSISREGIVKILSKQFQAEYNIDQIIDELISPAEILLLNSNGEYSFGHLRFQEYLASQEFVVERNINISSLLIKPWWHDVFLLYAQHARNIDWILEEVVRDEYMSDIKRLIKEMITFRPQNEHRKLNSIVQEAIWAENETRGEFESESYY